MKITVQDDIILVGRLLMLLIDLAIKSFKGEPKMVPKPLNRTNKVVVLTVFFPEKGTSQIQPAGAGKPEASNLHTFVQIR